MILTDEEKRMRDGAEGAATAAAMNLLIRYGDALACDRLRGDSCQASSTAPVGTRVFATDSAKQAHYLPAILGIEAWFGTLEDCVDAAVTGRWHVLSPPGGFDGQLHGPRSALVAEGEAMVSPEPNPAGAESTPLRAGASNQGMFCTAKRSAADPGFSQRQRTVRDAGFVQTPCTELRRWPAHHRPAPSRPGRVVTGARLAASTPTPAWSAHRRLGGVDATWPGHPARGDDPRTPRCGAPLRWPPLGAEVMPLRSNFEPGPPAGRPGAGRRWPGGTSLVKPRWELCHRRADRAPQRPDDISARTQARDGLTPAAFANAVPAILAGCG